MSINSATQELSLKRLFRYLLKSWKMLLIFTAAGGACAALVSSPLFITPLYKSSTIIYPVASNAISKSLLNINSVARQDIMEFGEDEQTEQMLQILSSSKLRDRVIKRFDLIEHYGLDTTSRYFKSRIYNRLESNIKIRRTPYMAVKITVYDRDSKIAAEIANSIPAIFDSLKNEMQKTRALKGFSIVESEKKTLESDIRQVNDSLGKIRELGVHDYESQSEVLNQQLSIELARGNQRAINVLEEKFKVLAKYGGPYLSLSTLQDYQMEQLNFVKSKLDEARIDAYEYLPQHFVVQEAFPEDSVSYPSYWAVILLSMLATLFFVSMILVLMHTFRKNQ